MALLRTIDLLPLQLEDGGIQLSELEVATEPRGPLAIVYYSDNGQPQDYGLRLDLEKQSFLDLDSFRDRWGSEEGLNRANAFAQSLANLVRGMIGAPAGREG
jgi:hypothetical protein